MVETGAAEKPEALDWQARLLATVADVTRAGGVPGIVIAIMRGDGAPEYLVHGADAAGTPLTADSLLPVASITKLTTALAALRLVAAGSLALDDLVGRHLPDSEAAKSSATVRDLFCHTAGLSGDVEPGMAPYQRGLDWPVLARAALATPLAWSPRTRMSYSNLGSGLLAVIVERLTGQPFPAALADLVLRPLGVEGYLGSEPPRKPAVLAGDLGEHAGTDLEPYNSAFWRALALPWGGMVTTAAGALTLARAFAGVPVGFLPGDLLAEATRDQTGGLPGEMIGIFHWPQASWGLGVDVRGNKEPHYVSGKASPGSFGHAGASGCLVWVDPAAGVSWAMLGARTIEGWMHEWPRLTSAILEAAGGTR
jgi:CubicO group peptidase (beta-lactamase class C family)